MPRQAQDDKHWENSAKRHTFLQMSIPLDTPDRERHGAKTRLFGAILYEIDRLGTNIGTIEKQAFSPAGWTGDSQLQLETGLLNLDAVDFARNWLQLLRDQVRKSETTFNSV